MEYAVFFHDPAEVVPRCRLGFREWVLVLMNAHKIRIRGQLVHFVAAKRLRSADAQIKLVDNQTLKELGFDGLSAASISGPRPREIMINRQNFLAPPKHWGNPHAYREYVVAHEILHSMNAHHLKAERGAPCPLMFAQTDFDAVQSAGCRISGRVSQADLDELDRHC